MRRGHGSTCKAQSSAQHSSNSLRACSSVESSNDLCKDPLDSAIFALETLHRNNLPITTDCVLLLLQRCAKEKDLANARRLGRISAGQKCNPPTLLADHTIRMFAACGSLMDADKEFHKIPKPSIFTWNAMISAHAKLGDGQTALELYHRMHAMGKNPDKYLISCILKLCSRIEAIEEGKLVHHQLETGTCVQDLAIGNALVFMYAKCGSVGEAQSVFSSLGRRDVTTWSALISGYSEGGRGALAIEVFQQMQDQGIRVDKVTLLCAFKACTSMGSLNQGMLIHNQVVSGTLEVDVMVSSAVVDMYVQCGSLQDANSIFERLPKRDSGIYSAMIGGCAEAGRDDLALQLFQKMRQEGTEPNNITFPCALKACGKTRALGQGKIIHNLIIRTAFQLDIVIGNTLVDFYAQCGALEEAKKVFDQLPSRSLISWGTIIGAYVHNGHGHMALQMYEKLQEVKVNPDNVIFLSVVKACSITGDLSHGRLIHSKIVMCGVFSEVNLENALLDMYSKCGSVEEARNVFDALPCRNLVSLSAMIAGYIEQSQWVMALELVSKLLEEEDMELDRVVFLSALKACGCLGTIGQGLLMHDQIIRWGLESDRVVGSALLDTYCKCGYAQEGYQVLGMLPYKDVVAWGAMIAGLVHGGQWSLASKCMSDMQRKGIAANEEIYSSILTACSSSGLWEQGQQYLVCMRNDLGIPPCIEHYGCMIDLLGRTGQLMDSRHLVQTMPTIPNDILWTSLLTSCKTYSNVNIGSFCFNEAMLLGPGDGSGYVLMSHILAEACASAIQTEHHELKIFFEL